MGHDSTRSRWGLAKVGAAIRKLRETAGLTQEELAKKTGIQQSHISRLERGQHSPSQTTIERIAAALDASAGEIDPSFAAGGTG